MVLPDAVCLTEPETGYPVFEISHSKCSARVALHGAHVMSWRPVGHEEVLYLSPDAVFQEGTPIRGGIPVCWPWFNRHPNDPALPSHGLVRGRFWELLYAGSDASGVTLLFGVQDGSWNAQLRVQAGEQLEVTLISQNESKAPIRVSGALHTYLAVSDIRKARVTNLDDCPYIDMVGTPSLRTQAGDLTFAGEVDRIYDSTEHTTLVDDVSARTVLIEKNGSPSTVVWNPWVDKAAALADLPDADYQRFCCIEAAIANNRAATVMPGCSQILATRISLL